ncbi:MAG: hypothetical protein E7375_00840 [Clostridiales bacterium]|nr:hypothetical protein [Clostridiales bacterium]
MIFDKIIDVIEEPGKKILKRVMILGLAIITSLTIISCSPTTTTSNSLDSDEVTQEQDKGTGVYGKEEESKKEEFAPLIPDPPAPPEPKDYSYIYKEFMGKMDLMKNYRVDLHYKEENLTWKYQIQQDSVCKDEGDQIQYVYFLPDGSAKAIISTDYENFSYMEHIEAKDPDSFFLTTLENTGVWGTYDEATGKYEAEWNGQKGYFIVEDDRIVFDCDLCQVTIYDFGKVDFVVPFLEEEQKLFIESENSEKEYNVKAWTTVLNNWFAGDNQYGQDYYNKIQRSRAGYRFDKILYMDFQDDQILIATNCYFDDSQNPRRIYQEFIINESAFLNQIKNGEIETQDELKNYLLRTNTNFFTKGETIDYEYASFDQDCTYSFQRLKDILFNRIEQKGTQVGRYDDNPETRLEGFQDAKVYFGFKTKVSDSPSADSEYGYAKGWRQYFLIEYKGKLEWVKMNVRASVHTVDNELDNIFAGNSTLWEIQSIERTEVTKENKTLYVKEDMTIETEKILE